MTSMHRKKQLRKWDRAYVQKFDDGMWRVVCESNAGNCIPFQDRQSALGMQ